MDVNELYNMLETQLNTYEAGFQRDIYQHSLYMTRAQDIYYDTLLDNFEETNTISEKMDHLISTMEIESFTNDKYGGFVADFGQITRKILRERVKFDEATTTPAIYRGDTMQVREERLSEIESSLENPFRTPGEHYVLRAIEETSTFNKVSLYIPAGAGIATYTVTLGIEPQPIVLEDLPDGLTIRGEDAATTVFHFKNKDLEKIVGIAVGLILQDASKFGERSRQGVEAIGESTEKQAAVDTLAAVEANSANAPQRPKVATEHIPGKAEEVLSAVEAVSASSSKVAKQESRDIVPTITEHTLSALEQQMLAQPRK